MQDRDDGNACAGLSRRSVLVGAAAATLAAAARGVVAAPEKRQRVTGTRPRPTTAPLRRFMAASAILPDGRVVVTGGYDRPWVDGGAATPLNTVAIYDPISGSWSNAAPMGSPRARHTAVTLRDGRIAVLGGLGLWPLASVEIYDPRTNSWTAGPSLAQPRYDHNAVTDGSTVTLLGGSSTTMLSSIEFYQF